MRRAPEAQVVVLEIDRPEAHAEGDPRADARAGVESPLEVEGELLAVEGPGMVDVGTLAGAGLEGEPQAQMRAEAQPEVDPEGRPCGGQDPEGLTDGGPATELDSEPVLIEDTRRAGLGGRQQSKQQQSGAHPLS